MSDITNDEVKNALTEIRKNFEEQKNINEKRLEALRKERSTTDFDEKLSRINDALSKQEQVQRDFIRQQERLADERASAETEWKVKQEDHERKLEARINRAALGLGGIDPNEVNRDERLKRRAYEKFLRHDTKSLTQDEQKVLSVSNDPTGGYLAPATFVQDIIKAEVLYSPMRALVNAVTISTGELQLPKRTQTAAATRIGEMSARSETQNPNWGLMKIGAPDMYAEARVTQANLEDSAFNLEQLLTDEFAEQFGVTEGNEIILGNGVGKCLGILDANAAGVGTPIANTVSGSAATIAGPSGAQGDGIVALFHAVKTAYAARGSWVMNRLSLGKVRLLKDTTGQYLWQPGLATLAPPTILGAPYIEAPDMPDEGANAFPIAFGDWKRAYTLVDRIEMAVTRDPFSLANVGQVKFYARRRVGGQVVLGEAIRLLKCSV